MHPVTLRVFPTREFCYQLFHKVNFHDFIFAKYALKYLKYFLFTATLGNVKLPSNDTHPERTIYSDFGTGNLYYFLSKGERGPLYTIPKKTYLRRTDFWGLMGYTASQPQYSISSSFNTFPIPMNESYLNIKVPLTNIEQTQIL
jgi:hypothetical protein